MNCDYARRIRIEWADVKAKKSEVINLINEFHAGTLDGHELDELIDGFVDSLDFDDMQWLNELLGSEGIEWDWDQNYLMIRQEG